ncbi:MAG TPA: nucleotide exchange factor GrpE [Planctomycetota bacterium]|nr:nucleotide exchange factor GrpE [Planctomycetota bacterium]
MDMTMADEKEKEKDANGQNPAKPEAADSVTLPRSEVEALRAAEARAAEYLDLAKRTQAEFVNYQARARREREEFSKIAAQSVILEVLPILDSLTRLAGAPKETTAAGLVEGIRIIEREMLRVLAKSGVRPMETVGKKFDPSFHEAVDTVDAPPGTSESVVLEEVRRGFMIHDRVLRPAQVIVGRPASAGPTDGAPEGKPASEKQ